METIVPLNKLYLFVGVFLAVCILVIAAIMLDLWDGVHTAKKTHQRVHSHKLRVTIAKMSEYWRFIMIGFISACGIWHGILSVALWVPSLLSLPTTTHGMTSPETSSNKP